MAAVLKLSNTVSISRRAALKVGNVYYLNKPKGQIVVDFIEDNCVHVMGPLAGRRYELMPFWKRAILELFGTVRVEDDLRRYTEAFWFVPRKNSKTLTVASIGLALISPITGEKGARVFICSSTEDQAKLMFEMCVLMCTIDKVDMDPDDDLLKQHYRVYDNYIECTATGGILRVLSGNPKGKTGSNPSAILIDEEHEFTDCDLEDAVGTGVVARKEPMTIKITTAGKFIETLPWMKDYKRAKRVLEGKQNLDWLHAIIWEADPKDDPGSPATWKKANPGWNLSVNARILGQLWEKMREDPARKAKFCQLNLNLPTEASSGYIPYPRWEACAQDYTEESLEGKECYGGIDLGTSDDLSAFSLVFPTWRFETAFDDKGKEVQVARLSTKQLTWYWSPAAKVDATATATSDYPYQNWVDLGLIEKTAGDIADYSIIRQRIKDLSKRFKIKEIGFDPYRMGEMAQNLTIQDRLTLIKVSQSFHNLHEPTTRYKELVFQREIAHNNNAVFNWNIKNARAVESKKKEEEKKIMLSKGHSTAKIDGLAAHLNAWHCLLKADPPKPPFKIWVLD